MNFFRNLLQTSAKKDAVFFSNLRKITSLKSVNRKIYQTAFTHRSLNLKDNDGHLINFERLEFLGDSMLGIVVSNFLYKKFPHAAEGKLTRYRAKIVSRENLNHIGKKMGLINFLDLEQKVRFGSNIHGNLLEALIGAVLIDRGHKKCSYFILNKILEDYVDTDQLEHLVLSYKGSLIEWGQKTKKNLLIKTHRDNGLDPKINYITHIYINDKQIVKARGASKKKSEEKAAKRAFSAMNIRSRVHG